MGIAGRFSKGGGGKFNGDGTITQLKFVRGFPFGDGGEKEGKATPLYVFMAAKMDSKGGEEEQTALKAAFDADEWIIDPSGTKVTPVDAKNTLPEKQAFGRFYRSYMTAPGGSDIAIGDDATGSVDIAPLLGNRVRFTQVDDVDTMAYYAKNHRKYAGLYDERGHKKSKSDNKYYAQRTTEVSEVLAAVNTLGVTAGKPTAATPGNGAATDEATRALAASVLVDVATAAGGTILKTKLPMAVITRFTKPDLLPLSAQREDVRKLLGSDEYLAALAADGGPSYDKATGTIRVN
jgi:hypothetical protein